MKVKHLLTLAVMAAIGGSANAQELANGTYYIQNVESGLFLSGTNSWGTQGTVSTQGEMFQVDQLADGTYTLTNTVVTAGNKTFGYNLFVDTNTSQNGNTWTIAPVDGKDGVYTLYGKGKANNIADSFDGYLSQSATAGGHIGYVAGSVNPADATAEWRFLTKEEAIAQLKTVTWGNSMPASFLLENPNFSRNHATTAWTVSTNCTNKNLAGGDNGNMCAESFHSPFTISQTIDVPNGVYGVTAQGFVRVDEGAGVLADAVFFANEATAGIPEKTGNENSMTDASNSFKTGAYTIEEFKVTVTNGKLEVGVKNTAGNLWVIWDNFNLTYYGIDVTALQTALAAKITEAEAITGNMNADVASALSTAITNAKNCAATQSAIEAVLAELNPAIDDAKASVAQYADVAAKVAGLDAAGQAAFAASESGTKYAAKTLAATDDITTDYIAAVKAQTTPGSDFTALIVNPQVNGADGWTISRPKGGNGPLYGGTAFEYWGGNASPRADAQFDYYQVIEGLPNGTYTLSADMYNSLNGELGATWAASSGLYGNNNHVLVDADGDVLKNYSVEVSVTNGTLRLGVKNFEQMAARWFVADNFQLTFKEAIKLDDYINTIGDLLTDAAAITGTQSATTASALSAAMSATAGYTSETNPTVLQGYIDALNTAIENSNASVTAYTALKTALDSPAFVDRSAAFGTAFTYRTEAQTMYTEATAATADVNAKATGMLNAYRDYVKAIAANYPTVPGVADARTKASWEYTTNPQNNQNFNNPGNNDVIGNTMYENWRGAGLSVGDMKQTVTGLPDGKYFLRMVSFTRNSINENDYIYIKSGSEEAQALSLGDAAASNGFVNITNPIEVTNGEVEIGLHVGSGCDWAAIGGVVLYAVPENVTRTTAADAYGTICLPYAFTTTDAKIYSAAVNGNEVELTIVDAPVAGTPYIYQAETDNPTFTYAPGGAMVTAPVAAEPLVGVFADTQAPVGSYVLQTQAGEQKFFIVADGKQPTVSANKAYITVVSSARELNIAEEATGIKAVNALVNGDAKIYDINGRQLNSLQKGINIVNGVKVLVK